MSIEDDVKAAIEEFGNDAFARFESGIFYAHFQSNNDIKIANSGGWAIKLKPLPELFAHGVEFYGLEKERELWQFKGPGGNWQDIPWSADYDSIIKAMRDGFYEHRRKTSAALPFDLERAIAGDVVEMFKNVE